MIIDKYAYRLILFAALTTLGIGTVFYHYQESLSWLDSYYFSVTTLATVGYGDIEPKTNLGKIFTTLYMFVGVGIVTSFITALMHRRGERIMQRHKQRKT